MPEDRQETGKHPHKSTEEPYPHRKENEGEKGSEHRSSQSSHHSGSEHSGSERSSSERSSGQPSRSENADLREREYRDNEGNVHHHTHTYEEQHGKENKK